MQTFYLEYLLTMDFGRSVHRWLPQAGASQFQHTSVLSSLTILGPQPERLSLSLVQMRLHGPGMVNRHLMKTDQRLTDVQRAPAADF